MAPRRGGAGGAGAEVAVAGSGRGYFEPPPLKRMQPWAQDGTNQTDILAGGVDETGIFKGVYVSGVHMLALLRTFQLAKAFMPVDLPTPVATLGQSLRDGIPLVVITRGCFGRELDYGPGPVRNKSQKAVWEAVRDFRADMPQVHITCIDVPNNVGNEVINGVLEAPLNEYRELMYHDGTWYTPAVHNASSLGRWISENQSVKSQKHTTGPMFQRKRFDWVDASKLYGNSYIVGWKAVLEVRPPQEVTRRTDLNFREEKGRIEVPAIKMSGPSGAECTFRKSVARAREAGDAKELLASVAAYMARAAFRERDGLREAIKVAEEAAELLKAQSHAQDAFAALRHTVIAKMALNEVEDALQVAQQLQATAPDPKREVEALRLVIASHTELGDLDKALEAARAGLASVEKKGDAEAISEAKELVNNALRSKGEEP